MSAHFFKAYSRLGLPNRPEGQSEKNLGVEEGPDAILTADFLSNFQDSQVDEFHFSNPEDVKDEEYEQILVSNLEKFKDLINQNLKPGQRQVVIGGENSVTLSSLLAVLERVEDPQKVGYIQFDSHGEMNQFETSPTKNFHGMYMRPFFDNFDIPAVANLVNKRLEPRSALFIGNLDLDPEEADFFQKMNFKNINGQDLEKFDQVLAELQQFKEKFDYIHINFDVDVFDKSEVLATGIPAEKGLLSSVVLPLLELLSDHPGLSFDLSELNPQKPGAKETVLLAQKVLSTICQ